MLALLPHNTDPWPAQCHSLADSMKPIDLVETSHNPGQTSDPTVANVRSVSSPPRSSRAGEKPSTLVVSVPYSVTRKPPAQSTLPFGGVVTHNRQASNAGTSTVYVPPTNIVNPPLSSGQPLGAQPVVSQAYLGYGYPSNQVLVGNMNYQPTPTGMSYTRIPYPGNTFTPWGKPNCSYMPALGGIAIHTTGGARGPPYGGTLLMGPGRPLLGHAP